MSDYQKGALQDIQNLIKEANKNKVKVFIDQKVIVLKYIKILL